MAKQRAVANSLREVLSDPKSRRLLTVQLVLLRAGRERWTEDQIVNLLNAVSAVADAFKVDVDRLLSAIGDLDRKD